MSRIESYLEQQVANKRRAEKNAAQAQKILKNLETMKAMSDEDIIAHNRSYMMLSERDKKRVVVDPIDGTKALDPVYRKISLAVKYAHDPRSKYWSMAGLIHGYVNDELQISLEERKMKKAEYMHLLRTSKAKLLEEWAEMINKRIANSA